MSPCLHKVQLLLLVTATANISSFPSNTHFISDHPFLSILIPREVLQKVNVSEFLASACFLFALNHYVSFVRSLVRTAACPFCPSPKYKVRWFWRSTSDHTTGGLPSTMSDPYSHHRTPEADTYATTWKFLISSCHGLPDSSIISTGSQSRTLHTYLKRYFLYATCDIHSSTRNWHANILILFEL